MNKRDVLQELSFGRRVAEEEIDQLAAYFVETDLWRRIYGGEIDVVYGPKGSGKSAIYSILVERASELFDRGILIQPAENPRGTPAFADLIVDPPTTEYEFVALWKLYLLQLIASVISDFSIDNEAARYVIEVLEDAGFKVRPKPVLKSLLHGVRDYVRRAQSVEGQVTIAPDGTPTGLVGRITFREPNAAELAAGFVSVDALLQHANDALVQAGYQVWIMLDRLDVAFSETPDLERNALRALFKVYLDIGALGGVSMKIGTAQGLVDS